MFQRKITGQRLAFLPPLLLMALLISGCDTPKPPSAQWQYGSRGLSCGAFSGDGQWVLAGDIDRGAGLWPLRDETIRYRWNHRDSETTVMTACGFAADAALALTASGEELALWNTLDGRALRYWQVPSAVHDLALTAGGRYALLGLASGEAALFDIQNGGVLRVFTHDDDVIAVALSADGQRALTGSDDYSARLWDVNSGKLLQRWEHKAPVFTVALSADGQTAFTSARYDGGRLWNTTSGRLQWQLPDFKASLKRGQNYAAARILDQSTLLTGTGDRRVQQWDISRKQQQKSWQLPEHQILRHTSATVLDLERVNQKVYALASDGYTYLLE